jgi:hypothetical protein
MKTDECGRKCVIVMEEAEEGDAYPKSLSGYETYLEGKNDLPQQVQCLLPVSIHNISGVNDSIWKT